tara:strand:+ start:471 stop:644 length:174 start_codon:yes stop_codon:yes gene_type:complete
MSIPFLILAGVATLLLANDVQTNPNTNTMPLFLYLIYTLSGTFFLFTVFRVVRILSK